VIFFFQAHVISSRSIGEKGGNFETMIDTSFNVCKTGTFTSKNLLMRAIIFVISNSLKGPKKCPVKKVKDT
jgi:hypothetical protein